MLKLKTSNGDLLFGLDRENVDRLVSGKPILVKGSDLSIDHDIFIVFGESLDQIVNEFNLPKVQ